MADEDRKGQSDVERLEAELAAARAEAQRYKGAYEKGQAVAAEAARRAKVDEAGRLTAEEQDALDKFGEVDPSGKAAMEAVEAARRRREEAMLEAGAGGTAADTGAAMDFDGKLTRLMGSTEWRATLKSPEYADWFARQPGDIQALGREEDPASAARVLTLYDASKGDAGMSGRDDPRLEGARNAPGGRGLVIGGTRPVSGRGQQDVEIDENDYMAGWNYAGEEFEDNYRMLDPRMNDVRQDRLRAR